MTTITVRQETSASLGTAGTTLTITPASAYLAGSSLHLIVTSLVGDVITLTGDGTNTFTSFGPATSWSSNGNLRMRHWYADNVAASGPTITLTNSHSTTQWMVFLAEISNTSGHDQSLGVGQTNQSSGTLSSGTVTPTASPGLLHALSINDASFLTVGSGFTAGGISNVTDATSGGHSYTEYERYTSTAAVQATWGANNNGNNPLFALATYKEIGDGLISASTQDLVTYNNEWTYCLPATTNWIDVGSTGAFCNTDTSANPAFAFFSGQFTADQQAQCTLQTSVTNAFGGVAVRLSAGGSGPTGYFAWFDAAHYNIGLINNGVLSSLTGGPVARTSSSGDVFLLQAIGQTLTLSVNGVTLKQVTDSTLNSGNPGLAFNGTHPSTIINAFIPKSLGTNLSGQTLTSVIGQVSNKVNYNPTAQTASFTVGTIPADALTISLGAQTISSLEGQLVFVVNLTGQTATFSEGVITISMGGNITQTLAPQSLGFSEGVLADNISYILDQGAVSINVIAQTATFTQGAVPIAFIDYFPPAETLTSTEGVIAQNSGLSLTAQTIVSLEGNLSASLGNNFTGFLSGQAATFAQGSIGLEADYFPSAQTLSFTLGTLTFSTSGQFTTALLGQLAQFTLGSPALNLVQSAYPNVTGMLLAVGTAQLETAGAIVPASIGYFGTWPISVQWVPSTAAPFVILSQSIPPGSLIIANQPVMLTVSEPDESVAYP